MQSLILQSDVILMKHLEQILAMRFQNLFHTDKMKVLNTSLSL